jgi:hypothetical protein
MKRFTMIMMMFVVLFTTSCADSLKVDGKTYRPYGFMDEEEFKDPNVVYKPHAPNIVGAIIFSETLIFPIYVLGWEFYEPVGLKNDRTEVSND